MTDIYIPLIIASVIAGVLVAFTRYDLMHRKRKNGLVDSSRLNRIPPEQLIDNLGDECNGANYDDDEFAEAIAEYIKDGPAVRFAKEEESAEERTRGLIGDELYERMAENVEHLLHLHRADSSINVNLTSGPDTAAGAAELHHLLPGDPVWLRKNIEGGMDVVDVYSGGYRIGRLMLRDVARIMEVMESAVITGSYVSEPNGWGDCDSVSLGIIVFHSSPQEYKARCDISDARPYMITIDGPQRIVLYQN